MEVPQDALSVVAFLYLKWMEEDGNGLNLVVETPARQEREAHMLALLSPVKAAYTDPSGNKCYWLGDLESAWAQSTPV